MVQSNRYRPLTFAQEAPRVTTVLDLLKLCAAWLGAVSTFRIVAVLKVCVAVNEASVIGLE